MAGANSTTPRQGGCTSLVQTGMPSDKTTRVKIIATLRKNRTAMEKLAADLLKVP